MAQQISPGLAKTDGRKRRWHQHKVERRTELVDGALEAIRTRGRDVSMDEIAAEIGVSKTVLYRYFVDKNDLTTAVMMRVLSIGAQVRRTVHCRRAAGRFAACARRRRRELLTGPAKAPFARSERRYCLAKGF